MAQKLTSVFAPSIVFIASSMSPHDTVDCTGPSIVFIGSSMSPRDINGYIGCVYFQKRRG